MFSIIFHPEADKEYAEAMIWYAEQKMGLEKRFELSVETIINKIQDFPGLFKYTRKPYREASVVLFPYTIVYKMNKRKQTIYIVAVYHSSRNPRKKYRK